MCFTGDTILPTSLGVLRFDELHEIIVGNAFGWSEIALKGLYVATRRGPRLVSAMFKAVSPVQYFETENGDSLAGVEDHPVLTLINERPIFQPIVLLDVGKWIGKPLRTALFADTPLPMPESWEGFFSKADTTSLFHSFFGHTHLTVKAVGKMSSEAQKYFIKALLLSNASQCPVTSYAGLVLETIDQAQYLKAIFENLGIQVQRKETRIIINPVSYRYVNELLGYSWIKQSRPQYDYVPCAGLFREYVRRLTKLCSRMGSARWSLIDRVSGARHAYRYATNIPRNVLEGVLSAHIGTSVEEAVETELTEQHHMLTQISLCNWTRLTRVEFKADIQPIFDLRVEGYPEYAANGIIVQ